MSVTVFVAGIHGAGKSTICRELARLIGASHATAGDLIRANATTEVTAGVKAVPDVDANQELLLRGLAMHRAASAAPLLLDGHDRRVGTNDRPSVAGVLSGAPESLTTIALASMQFGVDYRISVKDRARDANPVSHCRTSCPGIRARRSIYHDSEGEVRAASDPTFGSAEG